jgi:hypothetical protein
VLNGYSVVKGPRRRKNASCTFLTCRVAGDDGSGADVVEMRGENCYGGMVNGRRNYSQTTVKGYLKIVEAFAKYFHRSPDQLGPEQIRATEMCESETAGDIAPVLRNP